MWSSAHFRLFMYRYLYNFIDNLQILKNMKQITVIRDLRISTIRTLKNYEKLFFHLRKFTLARFLPLPSDFRTNGNKLHSTHPRSHKITDFASIAIYLLLKSQVQTCTKVQKNANFFFF